MRKLQKSVLAVILMTVIVLGLPAAVYADENDAEKLKKQSYETPADTDSLTGWPAGPKVYAKAAVIMDMDSGAILYAKNADEKLYPASITKLLTALVAVENSDFTDEVLFTDDSISFLQYDDAHIGMRPGEIINMKDALHALLLASANEVAYAIAENVGGKLGGGPMVGLSPVLSRRMAQKLFDLAEREQISVQTEVMEGRTGTTADSILTTRQGVPCCLLSIPQRSMHTPAEVCDLQDMEQAAQLLAAYAKEA